MNKLPFDLKSHNNNANRVRFNPEDYLQYLEGTDLTDEQARDVLAALWDIMIQFVDLGFQIDTDSESSVQVVGKVTPRLPAGKNNKKGEPS